MNKVIIASLLVISSCSFCIFIDNPDLNIINFPMGKPEGNQNHEITWEAGLEVTKAAEATVFLIYMFQSLPSPISEMAAILAVCSQLYLIRLRAA